MSSLGSLTKRGLKLFFKDKGMLFSSLITPLILLVLYITFLAKVYKDSFLSSLEAAHIADFPQELIDATVGGQLFSSLLAVCCITVAFCCNMTMVQDKVTGARKDLMMTPVKKSTLALSYYLSTFISTFTICLIAEGASFIYLANVGWYLSASDILLSLLDVFLLVMFGNGAFKHRQLLFDLAGADFGGRNGGKRGLRFHLRRIYAHIAVPRRASKSAFVSAGDIRNGAYPFGIRWQAFSERCPLSDFQMMWSKTFVNQ